MYIDFEKMEVILLIDDKEKKGRQPLTDKPFYIRSDNITTPKCNTFLTVCQDFTELGEIPDKFVPKRHGSILLAQSYARLDEDDKAERVENCGTFIEFAHAVDSYGVMDPKGRLHKANFCRDRLCPMCSWRRSYKIFAQVSQIMMKIHDKYEFLFLTLTMPNVPGIELNFAIDTLGKAWAKMTKRKKIKKILMGYFKALEITRNHIRGDYHPHIHIILAVPKGYFTGRDYIPQPEWLSMWRECMQDDRITQVDIRKATPKKNAQNAAEGLASAVAEIAKYTVKDSDYLIEDDPRLTDDIVFTLMGALRGRRLCAFDLNGAFGTARKVLNLDDPEDGDLVHIDEEDKLDPCVAYMIVRYGWSAGVYKMTDIFVAEKQKKEKKENA